MRIFNLLGAEMSGLLADRFGDRVEIVELVPDGPIEDDIRADAVLAPWRAAGRPSVDWLVELARHGVEWIHVAGGNVGDFSDELFAGGRIVTCSRGAMASPISEFALASMLAFEKRFPHTWIDRPTPRGWEAQADLTPAGEADEMVDVPPERWGYGNLGSLEGRTLGIFGFGAIGRATALKALAFGMRVRAARRRPELAGVDGVEIVRDVYELVDTADHIVIAAPGTPATRHIFDGGVFARTKPTAHLVNVARGSLVDQDALLRALDGGRLAFASLDVTDPEPPPEGHPLYAHPRVHLSPHVSWCSPQKQRRTGEIVLENVASYLAGETLHGRVDPRERY
jgi:phosphoglycerate dehydrogenase-like enzyme